MIIKPNTIYRVFPFGEEPYWLQLSGKSQRVMLCTDTMLDMTPNYVMLPSMGKINEAITYCGPKEMEQFVVEQWTLQQLKNVYRLGAIPAADQMWEVDFTVNDQAFDAKYHLKKSVLL